MHIPDSAISPATSLVAGVAMTPVWLAAGRRMRSTEGDRQVPLLAIGAAFCFTIMMFNIPAPGGTTVHPTGAVLLAALLGPAAAIIGMTVALAIQALFFGDGGVLALGVNAFTMAFAMPVCGYVVYRLAAGKSVPTSPRRTIAAGLGAYAGLNIAALITAIVLGIQPSLFHSADGRALYFPFGLAVTIPAISAAHLLVAGVAEFTVTAAALRYALAAGIPMFDSASASESRAGRDRLELLWAGLGAMAALAPLGLLARGSAWGEWGTDEVKARAGFVPSGLSYSETHGWRGFNLLPEYLGSSGPWAYAAAAVIGIGVVGGAADLVMRLLSIGRARYGVDADIVDSRASSDAGWPGEIPNWMLAPATESIRGRDQRRHLARDYVESTISNLADAVRDVLFAEKWASKNGLLQRLDSRVKIIGFAILILLTSMIHRPAALVGLYLLAMLLAAMSSLPAGLMARRVWLTVPLFVGVVTLPSVLNVVTPGQPLFVIRRAPLLAVTNLGIATAALLTFRVGVAVTFATLLTLTTRWNDLLRGLRILFVPRMFIAVTAMTYRYLGVLAQSASDMFTARKSRTVGQPPPKGDGRQPFLGVAVGSLFGKSLALTEEVHAAMMSRGWTGEPRSLEPLSLRRRDFAWLGAIVFCAALVVGGELLV